MIKKFFIKNVIPDDNTTRRFDWIINHKNIIYYVEMFGIVGSDKYDKNTENKIKTCQNNNLNFIALYPDDLKKPLNEVFSFLGDL